MRGDNTNRPGVSRVFRQFVIIGGLIVSVLLIVVIIYPWGGWLPSVLIFALTVVMLVRAYSVGHRYRCANCGATFRVPVPVDLLTGGGIGKNPDGTYHNWKSLTCPECGQRSRAVVVKADPEEVARLTKRSKSSAAREADGKTDAGTGDTDASRESSGRSPHAKRRRGKRH